MFFLFPLRKTEIVSQSFDALLKDYVANYAQEDVKDSGMFLKYLYKFVTSF